MDGTDSPRSLERQWIHQTMQCSNGLHIKWPDPFLTKAPMTQLTAGQKKLERFRKIGACIVMLVLQNGSIYYRENFLEQLPRGATHQLRNSCDHFFKVKLPDSSTSLFLLWTWVEELETSCFPSPIDAQCPKRWKRWVGLQYFQEFMEACLQKYLVGLKTKTKASSIS